MNAQMTESQFRARDEWWVKLKCTRRRVLSNDLHSVARAFETSRRREHLRFTDHDMATVGEVRQLAARLHRCILTAEVCANLVAVYHCFTGY